MKLENSMYLPITLSTEILDHNMIYNPLTYAINKWCTLRSEIQQSIITTIGVAENVCKRIWNQIVDNDMIHMYLVEAAMKMAAKQNTSLDLGFGISGKPNDLRLLNCFGAHILHCGSFPHFIFLQRNVNGHIFCHDSLWSSTNITDHVKLYMSKLFGEYEKKFIDFTVILGQQQSSGSLACALYCAAKLTEMVYGNDNLQNIYFQELVMRAHFAYCIASGRLIRFPRHS
eukprot:88255_1